MNASSFKEHSFFVFIIRIFAEKGNLFLSFSSEKHGGSAAKDLAQNLQKEKKKPKIFLLSGKTPKFMSNFYMLHKMYFIY